MMRELSLFSGAGGGLLATKHLLGLYLMSNNCNDISECDKIWAGRVLHTLPALNTLT
jgi:hypothetical protein